MEKSIESGKNKINRSSVRRKLMKRLTIRMIIRSLDVVTNN